MTNPTDPTIVEVKKTADLTCLTNPTPIGLVIRSKARLNSSAACCNW